MKIEALGFEAQPVAMQALQDFISYMTVLPLTDEIAEKTIQLRKANKIKLPDAVIAATALVHHLTLITRNTKDFKNIKNLSSFHQ